MNTTYTQSFNIPSGGWTGQFNGIMYAGSVSTATGLTANVVLWRDVFWTGNTQTSAVTLTNNAFTTISLAPGTILPIKGRNIYHNGAAGTVTGFN
jgi:DUF2075 family protein